MDVRIVLVSPRNPLNIGAAARAMSNFGFFELRLVNPYDAAFREARSAVGAAFVLEQAQVFSSLTGAVADCRLVVGTGSVGPRQPAHAVRRLEVAARLIRQHPGPVALVFGSEKFGLSNDDLSYCHWLLRIPTREEHGSMNLGQSVAVCLYELIRSGAARPHALKRTPPEAGELERLTQTLLEALRESGYLKPRTSRSMTEKVRRLVRRLDLDHHDAGTLQGMLRQFLWRFSNSRPPTLS